MPAPLIVPDASVLLKWVLPSEEEPDAGKALLLRAAVGTLARKEPGAHASP